MVCREREGERERERAGERLSGLPVTPFLARQLTRERRALDSESE